MPAACRSVLLVPALLALATAACGSDATLIKPGRLLAVIDTPHLHVLVPAHEVAALTPFVARAEQIYVRIAHDAGYTITGRLTVLLNDDTETHNGFSTTIPVPIVDIDIPPATQASFIFDGERWLDRTISHELTHHVSNDREPNPFRHILERIFGRIVPNDDLGLLFAYFTIPAHATMPSFWQEGCAQWTETVYSPADSPWGGRGRDSLTHMMWRLAEASPEGIPPVDRWRLTWPHWPYGNMVYIWGLAYLRYLDGAYGDRATIWQLIAQQEHQWPFMFNGGPVPLLGKEHTEMIDEARVWLAQEQEAQLARLRAAPVTTTRRLTPVDSVPGTPAWRDDQTLFAALTPPYGDPHFVDLRPTPAGTSPIEETKITAFAMGDARRAPDGSLVFTETFSSLNPWHRSVATIITASGVQHRLPLPRLLQADCRRTPGGDEQHPHYQLTALHLLPGAQTELIVQDLALDNRWPIHDRVVRHRVIPVRGHGWLPTFRPGHDQLTWVETDAHGSRLVLAPLDAPGQRTVLADVHGRLMAPSWTVDGAHLFVCADHTGVANAYCIDPDHPGILTPVTNVIGGILACVPSPDGHALAVVDNDIHGPYLALLSADRSTWATRVPAIPLPFPAPVPRGTTGHLVPDDEAEATPAPPAAPARQAQGATAPASPPTTSPPWSLPSGPGDPSALTTHPYHGLTELRPLFWTPTTLVVPTGGYGVYGVAADPIFTHVITAGVGAGPWDPRHPVAIGSYVYGGWPLDVGVLAYRAQLGWDHQVVDSGGNRYNYAEDDTTGEVLTGYGLLGNGVRQQLYVAAGVTHHQPDDLYTNIYQGLSLASPPTYRGDEEFVAVTAAYDDREFFPTSYTYENGNMGAATWQHSRYRQAEDQQGDVVFGRAQRVITVWPSQSHQIVLNGELGWSGGLHLLPGAFAIGGITSIGLPRGYLTTVATGEYAVAASGAYRLPLWRPYQGFSTSPWVFRQLVLEGFFDAGKVSMDRIGGDGHWYRSVGGELHAQWEFWTAYISPGLGIAQQLDANKDLTGYLALDFTY